MGLTAGLQGPHNVKWSRAAYEYGICAKLDFHSLRIVDALTQAIGIQASITRQQNRII